MIDRPSTVVGRTPARAASQPPGSAPSERAGGVGGDEQPGRRLRDPELLDVVRQQRRDRGVERRVDEHDGGGEEQQAAHRRARLGA